MGNELSIFEKAVLDVKFGDVIGELPELSSGAGFLLYIKNGVLDILEGYSYDDPWPSSIGSFKLKYVSREQRDWNALERTICEITRTFATGVRAAVPVPGAAV
jgi:hypothetical protein